MTYSTHTIHLEPTDTAAIERTTETLAVGHNTWSILALTVSDADGRTVARVELLGRPDQLDPVTLAPAGQAVPT